MQATLLLLAPVVMPDMRTMVGPGVLQAAHLGTLRTAGGPQADRV